jgi:hypothetical protein
VREFLVAKFDVAFGGDTTASQLNRRGGGRLCHFLGKTGTETRDEKDHDPWEELKGGFPGTLVTGHAIFSLHAVGILHLKPFRMRCTTIHQIAG